MTFQEMQKGVLAVADKYGKRFGIIIDQDFALLKLYEEVGEYAQAVLIHRKKSKPNKLRSEEDSKNLMAEELADIIGLAIMNAELFGIDLERAVKEKWLDRA
jgi:NTP pyrophosphatase (non-canonical NTP hydrolase)